jgi:hypothetical protein
VIVTGWGKEAGCQTGRTTCHRLVNFAAGEAPAELGSVVEVLVEESYPHSLVGRRVDQRPVGAENVGPRFRVLPLSS